MTTALLTGVALLALFGIGIFALQQGRRKETPQTKTQAQRRLEMTQPATAAITSMSDLRLFFHRNTRPIYFISATNFNLAGMDERVPHFKHINYIDCYDGCHPNVFVPSEQAHPEFEGIEDINNYLLQNKEVIDYIKRQGGDPVAVFLMFDEKTEELCKELGIELWFPPASLRKRCDNKMETVRIGNKADPP